MSSLLVAGVALTGLGVQRAAAGDDSAGDGAGRTHTIYVEYTNPSPTPIAPACNSAAPPQCVYISAVRSGVLGGDVTGTQVSGLAVIVAPNGGIQSWTGTGIMTLTSGPCGAGSFVTQTVWVNAKAEVNADGVTTFTGDVRGTIVPGSGTGGYEGVTGRATRFGGKPPVDGVQTVFNTIRLKCRG